jgi:hypothetical protein
MPADLRPWIWFWVPLCTLALALGTKKLEPGNYERWIVGEWGLVENLTLVALTAAVIYAVKVVRLAADSELRWLRIWAALIGVGAVYFLGEEASWGQHIFGWSPPEDWARLNQQNETNLHNIEGFGFLFDQVPRNLLSAAAVLGGILAPLYRLVRSPNWTPQGTHYWLWPTLVCTPSAFMAVFISVPQKLYKTLDATLPELLVGLNSGELKECFLAFFILLYMASLASRLRQVADPASDSPPAA